MMHPLWIQHIPSRTDNYRFIPKQDKSIDLLMFMSIKGVSIRSELMNWELQTLYYVATFSISTQTQKQIIYWTSVTSDSKMDTYPTSLFLVLLVLVK